MIYRIGDYIFDEYEKSLAMSCEMCDLAIKYGIDVEEAKALKVEFQKRLYESYAYKKSLNKNEK